MTDVDLRANLNNENDDGFKWGLLRNASDPDAVRPGAILKAGRGRTWSWVRIVSVDPDGQVHFETVSRRAR
jgi:hypothetical protein